MIDSEPCWRTKECVVEASDRLMGRLPDSFPRAACTCSTLGAVTSLSWLKVSG